MLSRAKKQQDLSLLVTVDLAPVRPGVLVSICVRLKSTLYFIADMAEQPCQQWSIE